MIQFISRHDDGYLQESTLNFYRFPAGEPNIHDTATSINETLLYAFVTGCEADDLILLGMAADYAHQKGTDLTVFMPYLPGARADRGIPFGAQVYANIINSLQLKEIICFDPHSEVMPSLINNVTVIDLVDVLKRSDLSTNLYSAVISPDAGALRRATQVAEFLTVPVVEAGKHRDFQTTRLTGFHCNPLPDPDGLYLIVDDICDGGGTFFGLAETININPEQLHVWVSHGVFNGKAKRITQKFSKIYTTNSHPGCYNPEVGAKVTDLLPYFLQYVQNR